MGQLDGNTGEALDIETLRGLGGAAQASESSAGAEGAATEAGGAKRPGRVNSGRPPKVKNLTSLTEAMAEIHDGKARTSSVGFKVSKKERKALEEDAAAANVSLSEFLRFCAAYSRYFMVLDTLRQDMKSVTREVSSLAASVSELRETGGQASGGGGAGPAFSADALVAAIADRIVGPQRVVLEAARAEVAEVGRSLAEKLNDAAEANRRLETELADLKREMAVLRDEVSAGRQAADKAAQAAEDGLTASAVVAEGVGRLGEPIQRAVVAAIGQAVAEAVDGVTSQLPKSLADAQEALPAQVIAQLAAAFGDREDPSNALLVNGMSQSLFAAGYRLEELLAARARRNATAGKPNPSGRA